MYYPSRAYILYLKNIYIYNQSGAESHGLYAFSRTWHYSKVLCHCQTPLTGKWHQLTNFVYISRHKLILNDSYSDWLYIVAGYTMLRTLKHLGNKQFMWQLLCDMGRILHILYFLPLQTHERKKPSQSGVK